MSETAYDAEFDYVIVGAGSAGAALAHRLSESGDHSVRVLEYGGSDNSIFIKMPTAFSIPMNMKRYDWGFHSEKEPGLKGRSLHQARGKVLGGSSSINGLVYVRGCAGDFEEWEELGAAGWGYQDVLPYFKRGEDCVYGGDAYRGDQGGLTTCNGNNMKNPLYRAFIKAGEQAGYGYTEDYNGYRQEGFGRMDMTVRDGVRCSTAMAYLKPAMNRPNLDIQTHALTTRVIMEGKTAVGVEYRQGGKTRRVRARKEVILSASSFNSPKLLMLSGIGPADHLKEHGIEVVHDLPGVGRNLQDHLEVWVQQECTQKITLNSWLGPLAKAWIGANWLFLKRGLGTSNQFESNGYIRSRAGMKYPDIQFHFLAGAIAYDGSSAFKGHGFQVHLGANKPKSRGWVKLKSADPEAPRKSSSTTSPKKTTRKRSAPACAGPARFSPSRRWTNTVARKCHRARTYKPTRRSTSGWRKPPRPPTTRPAPAAWAPTPWRWWTRSAACTGCATCAWWTRPSCPPSPTATSTRRPS